MEENVALGCLFKKIYATEDGAFSASGGADDTDDLALAYREVDSLKDLVIAKRFFEEWIPMERLYFEGTNAETRCDMVISVAPDDSFEKSI